MAVECGNEVLTDAEWAILHPLIEAGRPRGKTPPQHLRRTVTAILWRHTNGAKWGSIPSELGPWWMAAQTFIRWARLGVWERVLDLAQRRGVALGMTFPDGTNIRAHAKAAGASKKRGSGAQRDVREALESFFIDVRSRGVAKETFGLRHALRWLSPPVVCINRRT